MTEHGVFPVAWDPENGSEFVEISAKFNQNLDELLDTVLLVAEVQELKADPTVRAIGTVVEARLDQGKGAIATLLVQQGTLHVQDPIVVGNTYGRVRTMTNDLGRRIKEAGPSTPIELTGLSDVPQAVLTWTISLILLKKVKLNLLTLSSKRMFKVLQKRLLLHFKKLKLKV